MLNHQRLLILSMHLQLLLLLEVTQAFSLHPGLFGRLNFNLEYLSDSWPLALAPKLRVGVWHLNSTLASKVFFFLAVRRHFNFLFSCFDDILAVRRRIRSRIVKMLHRQLTRNISTSGVLSNAPCTSFLSKNCVV